MIRAQSTVGIGLAASGAAFWLVIATFPAALAAVNIFGLLVSFMTWSIAGDPSGLNIVSLLQGASSASRLAAVQQLLTFDNGLKLVQAANTTLTRGVGFSTTLTENAVQLGTTAARVLLVGSYQGQLVIWLKEDWRLDGRTWPSGAVLLASTAMLEGRGGEPDCHTDNNRGNT